MANTNSVFTDLSTPDGVADALAANHADLPLHALRLLARDRDDQIALLDAAEHRCEAAVTRMHAAYAAQESAEKKARAADELNRMLLAQADVRELALVQAKEENERLASELHFARQAAIDTAFNSFRDEGFFGHLALEEQERRDAIAAHAAPIGARDLVSPETIKAWVHSMAQDGAA